MTCRYTLWLQYDVNKFYLAPRSSILVEEETDFEQLQFAGDCCAKIANRDWHFKLHFVSGCDTLLTAWTMFQRLEIFLDVACSQDLTINRKVCDESLLVYKITNPRATMVETNTQLYARPRSLTIDLVLGMQVWPPDGMGVVSLGG